MAGNKGKTLKNTVILNNKTCNRDMINNFEARVMEKFQPVKDESCNIQTFITYYNVLLEFCQAMGEETQTYCNIKREPYSN